MRHRWLLFLLPLLAFRECPEDWHYTVIELHSTIIDYPVNVTLSCMTSPSDPVEDVSLVVCHPDGRVGLQITGSCKLEETLDVTVDLDFIGVRDCYPAWPGLYTPASASVTVAPDDTGLTVVGNVPEPITLGDDIGGVVVDVTHYVQL